MLSAAPLMLAGVVSLYILDIQLGRHSIDAAISQAAISHAARLWAIAVLLAVALSLPTGPVYRCLGTRPDRSASRASFFIGGTAVVATAFGAGLYLLAVRVFSVQTASSSLVHASLVAALGPGLLATVAALIHVFKPSHNPGLA